MRKLIAILMILFAAMLIAGCSADSVEVTQNEAETVAVIAASEENSVDSSELEMDEEQAAVEEEKRAAEEADADNGDEDDGDDTVIVTYKHTSPDGVDFDVYANVSYRTDGIMQIMFTSMNGGLRDGYILEKTDSVVGSFDISFIDASTGKTIHRLPVTITGSSDGFTLTTMPTNGPQGVYDFLLSE